MLAIAAFFALVVVVVVIYFEITHRDGWMPLELGWALIPFFVASSIFVWASIVFFQNTSPK
jgi:hypothetical protein